MATLQEQLEASVSKLNTDSDIMHQIVHANWQTVVNTEGGPVKSLAKAIYDLEAAYAADDVIAISQTNNNDAFNWANRAPDSGYTDSAGHTGYSARHYAQKAKVAASQLPTNKFDATRDPGVNDDANAGFAAGSNWLNVSSKEAFKCIDSAVGAAVWVTTTLTLDELGTAAAQNVGTGAGQIPILDTDAKFPSIDLAGDAASPMQPVTKRQLDATTPQEVWSERGDAVTCAERIILDDSVPQISEGTEILNTTITPRAIGSKIEIEARCWGSQNNNDWVVAAIFQDSSANAIASGADFVSQGGAGFNIHLRCIITTSSLSPIEISLRLGPHGPYVATVNGRDGGRLLGGAGISSLRVREVLQ
ncbi:virulence factor Pgp3 [Thalassospira sp. TSL5-1]|uniref:virulence factor Pgp3 n=1 Tax=Thalassospira sp. TSL5-1 TaxID=1544451 RepID=UPI000939E5E9|nr:virulence factor Pgp3 [Thalassospira sp. TSL5-1]OKH89208.1 hypothetical protein LF95_04025 [Thalassospira sp. TSL5-1]